jgi:phosphoribosylformylglycinamidine synthase subunit PurS
MKAPLKARVTVTLKPGVLDPQGKAIEGALHGLGFAGVSDVRVGKVIELTLPDGDEAAAKASLEAMGKQLLANTVIENFRVEIA